MTSQDWADRSLRSIALFIAGSTDPDVDVDGRPLVDDDFLVCVNAWREPLTFSVPASYVLHSWEIVCDSSYPAGVGRPGPQFEVGPRSAVVMRSGR